MTLLIRRVGPEAAPELLAVIHAAFGARPPLDPPAAALAETEESLATELAAGGGLVAEVGGRVVGGLLLDPVDDSTTFVRRFCVLPSEQHHGIAHQLVAAAVDAEVRVVELAVLAREELPQNVGFWEGVGFHQVARATPYVELRRRLATAYDVPDADAMRDLGRRLAGLLRAGDVVVLTGELGAGKTTLTQGIGAGLGVRGEVTSPTFVIARVHPSLGQGPDLVHVDAYRLGGLAELDDLDLDTSLDDAVTIVEWGEGLAEALSESHLLVRIHRTTGATVGADPETDEARTVLVRGFGPRWHAAGAVGA